MCFHRNIETLPTFGIKVLRKSLREVGYSLGRVEAELRPGERFSRILHYYFVERNIYGREVQTSGEIVILRDTQGLLLEFNRGDYSYRLVRRESNLKRGTFRYYILDPYSPGESLCEKLYYLPGVCEFIPRSILHAHRVRYAQQRKGHSDRYYFSPKHIPEGKELRYRKSHYRGRETPFWRRYRELTEERDWRITEYTIGRGFADGVIPPDLEEEIRLEYMRHSGRKTLSSPLSLYNTRKSSTRRVKVSKNG